MEQHDQMHKDKCTDDPLPLERRIPDHPILDTIKSNQTRALRHGDTCIHICLPHLPENGTRFCAVAPVVLTLTKLDPHHGGETAGQSRSEEQRVAQLSGNVEWSMQN